MNQKGIDQIKKHEGFRQFVYDDTEGIPTIAFGRNLRDVGINADEGEYLLKNDVSKAVRQSDQEFPWMAKMNDARKWVIYNMVFNMGLAGFKKFKKTIAAAEAQDYESFSREMLDSKWSRQVGKRADELSVQMLTGDFPE
jgi:lysozyme